MAKIVTERRFTNPVFMAQTDRNSNDSGNGPHPGSSSLAPWSVRMTEAVIQRHPLLSKRWDYEFGLMLQAIGEVWQTTGKPAYFEYIRRNMDSLVDEAGQIRTYETSEYNLDQVNAGKVLFLLYRETGAEKYRKALFTLREQLRTHPRTGEGGFWHKKIYPYQMWLDGIYMAAPFYAEFAATFAESSGFDDVAGQIITVARHTRDPKTGLFYHGWDESKNQAWADPRTGCSPNFWGRAMGWYLMALVDVIGHFPPDHPLRPRLLEILGAVAEAVANFQDRESGLWYQVLDQGERPGNYLEASASCMFVYGLAKGVQQGNLDHQYLDHAKRGFAGIVDRLVTVEPEGQVNLNQICKVAGLGRFEPSQPYRDGSFEYYVGESVVTNDYKGVGPFILASVILERIPAGKI